MKREAASLSRENLELLLSTTRQLAAPFELSAMLAAVTSAARGVLNAERCSVWLLDVKAEQLVLRVASDMADVRVPLSRGLVGACARSRDPIVVADCYADDRFDPSTDLRTGFHTRCSLSMPLIDHRDELVGVIQLLNKVGGIFDDADIALAEALAAQCAVALSRVHLTVQAFKADQMRRELELARAVQLGALPKALPQVSGYSMNSEFRPAAETGGDMFDLSPYGARLLVLLADAAGHGIAPALAVMQLQSMLRTAFRLGCPLEAAFAQVNDQLSESLPEGHFITAFVAELNPLSHALRFISGGQAPILMFRSECRDFERFKANSFPMGAMPLRKQPQPVQLVFGPGDILVLLSDGIYEYENAQAEPYGRERVEAVIAATAAQPTADILLALLADVERFADGAPQLDDITAVLLKRDLG